MHDCTEPWTPEAAGRELGRLRRASLPLIVPLPGGRDNGRVRKFLIAPDVDGAAEVDVTGLGGEADGVTDVTGLSAMIRGVRDHGYIGYLTEHGRRVAAIVAVDES